MQPLELGNLDAREDWGYAKEYTEAMWMMNYKYGDDFVIGTGELHTVEEFVETAFEIAGISDKWRGSGLNEVGLSNSD
jgi:GDPmannose 4,6-dehydratase